MIPLKLTLEGVYSYRSRQTIDFQTLSEAGIFGVFGAVGSGKSAILESMTYALYGQIERLNDKEQRGYNIMNLQSDHLFIDFEFSHKNRDYRFTVSAKRHKKDFSRIQTPRRSGFSREEGEWIPLPEQTVRGGITAEPILNLSYEHFRKTVIIPQGKFQEFIMLPPSQRTAMIESLFGLERFNLSMTANTLLAKSREECAFLEGKLDDLKEIRNDDLKLLINDLKILDDQLAEKTTDLNRLTEELKELEATLLNRKEMDRIRKERAALLGQEEKIREIEYAVEQHQILEKEFSHDLNRLKDLKKQNQDIRKIQGELTEGINSKEIKLKEGQSSWEKMREDQENYPRLTRELQSLKSSLELKDLKKTSEKQNRDILDLEKRIERLNGENEGQRLNRERLKSLIEEGEQDLEKGDQLHILEDWYYRFGTLNNRITDVQSEQNEFIVQTEKLYELLRAEYPSLKTEGILPEKIKKDIQKLLAEDESFLERRQDELEQKSRTISQTGLLLELSDSLKDGQPCPLCGSEQHPEPLTAPSDASDLSIKTDELKQIRREFQTRKDRIREGLTRLDFLTEEIHKRELSVNRLSNDKSVLKEEFIWDEYDPENDVLLKKKQKNLQSLRKTVKEEKENLVQLERKISSDSENLNLFEREKIRLLTEQKNRQHQEKRLSALILPDLASPPGEGLLEDLEKRLRKLDKEYLPVKQARSAIEEELRRLKNDRHSRDLLLEKNESELKILDGRIQTKMDDLQLYDRNMIEESLSNPPDIRKLKEQLEAYFRKLKLLEDQQSKVEFQLSESAHIDGNPDEVRNRLKLLNDRIQDMFVRAGALREQKEDLTLKLNQKKELSKKLDLQKIRNENLKELSGLFKGRKFVEYIAAVYVQELCQMANDRFSPMTGRSLELVFQDNQIMVRDFLNEGRMRHIKTLSGGQTFQAALCLALALSEQTGRGTGSFFFLDEGFGSLDRASLETVMISLRKLSRDGRIIGLISHVEDLQQDLDVWLKISRGEETGSRVQRSWIRREST